MAHFRPGERSHEFQYKKHRQIVQLKFQFFDTFSLESGTHTEEMDGYRDLKWAY